MPYYYLETIRQLEYMHDGVALLDEMWRIVDCVTPDTIIMTHNNVLKAEDAFFRNPFLSLEGDKIVNSIPLAQGKRFVELDENLLLIRTRTREIKVSKNHRFFTIPEYPNFYKKHKGNIDLSVYIKEKKACELRKKDRILLAHKIPEPKDELISEKKSQLIGYILADGHIEYPHRWSIHLDDSSIECLEKYKELSESIGFTTSIHKHKNKNCYRLRLFGKERILDLLEDIKDVMSINQELKTPTTRIIDIPDKIIKSNNKILGAFLKGFFDGEAYVGTTYVDKNRQYMKIELAIKDKNIIEKIKYLMLRFGIDCGHIKKMKNAGFGKNSYIHKISIKDLLSVNIFRKEIGFCHPKKNGVLENIKYHNYKSKRKIYGDIEIGMIVSTHEIKSDAPYLIDFSIPSHENYIANGFIVHNSRMSRKASNKFVSDILARSRKRHLVYIFTAQVIDTIDKRIRKVADFCAYPMLGRGEKTVKCIIFRSAYPKNSNYMKTMYFDTFIPFASYDSNAEVDMIDDTDQEDPPKPPKLIWQEGFARCRKCKFVMTMHEAKCPECESQDLELIEPTYYDDWETADKFAQAYWEKLLNKEGIENADEDGL
jgi:intein/homing endonuclease